MRVDVLLEFAIGVRLGDGEEAVVKTDLGLDAVRGTDPVNSALHLSVDVEATGARGEVGGAAELGDLASGVFHDFVALDDAGIFEANFPAGFEAEVFRRRDLGKIVVLDVNLAGEGDLARGGGLVLRVVGGVALEDFARSNVREREFDRFEHGKAAERGGVEFLANRVIEDGDVGDAVELSHAHAADKTTQSAGGNSAAAQTGNSGHSGIVPARDEFILHELQEFAFADDGVAEVEFGEFVLVRDGPGQFERRQRPVVECAVGVEFERTDAVRDAFEVVAEAVGEVVERVDTPRVTGVVVRGVADAIKERITQPHI